MNILKHTLEVLGYLLSMVWSPRASELIAAVRSHVYTGYLRKRFKHFGRASVIAYSAKHLVGLDCIEIGDEVQICSGAQLTAWKTPSNPSPLISIGDRSMLREDIHITACHRISIGKNLLTGTNVLISDNSHGNRTIESLHQHPTDRGLYTKGPITIGDDVWIGNNVCILSGVSIGNGAVIGANSVVTSDVPAYSLAVGAPARIISCKQ